MNRGDISKLLHLIHTLSPAFTAVPATKDTPGTGDAWADLLADIPAADAAQAVRAHFATGGPWINVADIRRRVLDAHGLLPPDVETAYEQADRMNGWLGCRVGAEPPIHPAAMEAARAIGWEKFDGPEGIAHRRFVESYTPKAAKAAEQALTTPLPALESAVRAPKALPGGAGVEVARRLREEGGPDTFEHGAELQRRMAGNAVHLAECLAQLGADARFLIPPGMRVDSELGQAALRRKLRDYGADQNPEEAMRQARRDIAQHPTSDQAAGTEAAKRAALTVLEAAIRAESEGSKPAALAVLEAASREKSA